MIKSRFAATLFAVTLASMACSEPPRNDAAVGSLTYRSVGVVTAIDRERGAVTVYNEGIPGYMQERDITEPVGRPELLNGLKVGDRVEFEMLREGVALTFTQFTTVGYLPIGSEIYKTNCSECHGAQGEGGKKGIPLVSGHALDHPESEHIEQVKNGKGKKMPAFRDKLSQAEIEEVVRFVRNVIQVGVPPEKRGRHP